MSNNPGKVVLFGSGETSSSGRRIHERMFSELAPPVRVAILETPAGFQPNSAVVAQEVGDFISSRLRNFSPMISLIAARQSGHPNSTNDPDILYPMLRASYIFLGPGSPTYAVRHLKGSLALSYLAGRHRKGAIICLASAAAIAFGSKALPVYEIFKAGLDLHWQDGLDFFRPFGLDMAIVTHWDNREGGEKLDTSRCYMGQERWDRLYRMLPAATSVLGIDEHTAAILDFQRGQAEVMGKGGVTVQLHDGQKEFETGASFPLNLLGSFQLPPETEEAVPEVGPEVVVACDKELPPEAAELMEKRKKLRQDRRWSEADIMRQHLREMGYEIKDTPGGTIWCYRGQTPYPGSSK